MSIQRVGERKRRRLERLIDESIHYAYANGGYSWFFITDDHRHGWYDLKTEEWGWVEDPVHVHPICGRLTA